MQALERLSEGQDRSNSSFLAMQDREARLRARQEAKAAAGATGPNADEIARMRERVQ